MTPAKSQAQQMMMSIAKHHPEKLYRRNKEAAKMSKEQLGDFASTPRKGLPRKKGKLVGKALKRKRKSQ